MSIAPPESLVSPVSVDRRVHTEPSIYAAEMEKIFLGGWVYVGLEAEIPQPGDFKTTLVGEVPVIVVRDKSGAVRVVENACTHRGAKLAREPRGNCSKFTCLYHQWTFAHDGGLLGVPLRTEFGNHVSKATHSLRSVQVGLFSGLIFASFSSDAEPIEDYLGDAKPHIADVLRGGEVQVAGYQRFQIKANWKLFFENTQDAYHALQLHKYAAALDVMTVGENISWPNGHGVILWPMAHLTDEMFSAHLKTARFQMREFSMFQTDLRPKDGAVNRVMGIFPNGLLLEAWDQLNVRQIVPQGPGCMEVHTIALGLKGESPERLASRTRKFCHLFGPAGFAGLDDITACQVVQQTQAARGVTRAWTVMGDLDQPSGSLDGEYTVRGFYQAWAKRMNGAGARGEQ